METEKLQYFQKKLQQERDRLEKEIHEIARPDRSDEVPGDHDVKFEDIGREEGENAQEVETYERNLALERELEHELGAVKTALERFDLGVYGLCAVCDHPIPEDRLEAYPAASMCLECSKPQ